MWSLLVIGLKGFFFDGFLIDLVFFLIIFVVFFGVGFIIVVYSNK